MDDWKVWIQCPDGCKVFLDKTEGQARAIYRRAKEKKRAISGELIHAPIDADASVVESFDNKVIEFAGLRIII